MESRTRIHHAFDQRCDWPLERNLEALAKLKSEILQKLFFFFVCDIRFCSEAVHGKRSPCVRHLILKCNNMKLELMNASNLPGVWVIICFYVCQHFAQLTTRCQLGQVVNWKVLLARVSQYSRACGRAMPDSVRRVDCNWMYSSDSSTHLAFSLINDSNEMQLAISCRPTERFSTFAEGLHRRLPPPSPAARRCEQSDPSTRQAHSAPLDKKEYNWTSGAAHWREFGCGAVDYLGHIDPQRHGHGWMFPLANADVERKKKKEFTKSHLRHKLLKTTNKKAGTTLAHEWR